MNTKLLMTSAIITAWALSGQVNAEEKELRKGQVPKAVIESFEKAHPNARELEFEKEMFEGKVAYEVEYKENGKEYEFLYSADGMLLQKEEEIDGKSLPDPVMQGIKKAYPKAEIKEVEQLMTPDGKITGYEVDIKAHGKKLELELDADGKILKTEKD